jgi:hypothetical protein
MLGEEALALVPEAAQQAQHPVGDAADPVGNVGVEIREPCLVMPGSAHRMRSGW